MDIEKVFIGVLLQKNKAVADTVGRVFPDDFRNPIARVVYSYVLSSFREDVTVDLVTAGHRFPEHGHDY